MHTIELNLMRKLMRGSYRHDLAILGWGYLVDSGAKKYAKEFGSKGDSWFKMFDPKTRGIVSYRLAKDFIEKAKNGEFDGTVLSAHKTFDSSLKTVGIWPLDLMDI